MLPFRPGRARVRSSLPARWLRSCRVPADAIPRKRAQASARARRYPRPIGWLHPALLRALDWFGPLVALGVPVRAHRLSDARFEAFLRALKRTPHPLGRAFGMLAFLPLLEALVDDADASVDGAQTSGGDTKRSVGDARDRPPAFSHPLRPAHLRPELGAVREVDVVVIGSGAGGAPVALDLCRAGFDVAMIEQGGVVRPERPARVVERHYAGQGFTVSLTGGTTLAFAGVAVGGTTAINSGTCLRPRPECLRRWDEIAGTTFAAGGLDPHLARVEHQLGVCVPDRVLLSRSALLVERGLEAIGRPGSFVLPRNAPACAASGRCAFGCPTGAKRGTDLAYLPEAIAHGLRLLAHTRAEGIRERRDGVEIAIARDGERARIRCKTLVIAAGALFTPGLLRRHRLGSRWRAAGAHLKIHPASKIFAHVPGIRHGEGGIPQGTGYLPADLPHVTLEGIHTPRSMTAPLLSAGGARFTWWLDRHDDLASFGAMVRDRGTGRVLDRGAFPLLRYAPRADDARDLVRGLVIAARAFFAAGAERVLLPILGPTSNEFASPRDLDRFDPDAVDPSAIMASGFHPQGTAGIGRVVDADLRLLGSDRIRVCDASVLPDSPGVNPQLTIMALAHRLAQDLVAGA
ncbi:MAG: GMC family oxidoreductase N-terminal domain-containing protein [Deltaproteobacteria bacterium]|nr:GMC family oxidoreductase N-terminal domain-containing protein [Deltaproteobacteria bacterium]